MITDQVTGTARNFVQVGSRTSVKTTFTRLTRELQWKAKIRHGSPVFPKRQLIEQCIYHMRKNNSSIIKTSLVNCQSKHDICLFFLLLTDVIGYHEASLLSKFILQIEKH